MKKNGITVSGCVVVQQDFANLVRITSKKPDAITTMYAGMKATEKAWCLQFLICYMGNANDQSYIACNPTIGDLAKSDETLLVRKLGKMGSILWASANG